jgi:hypothetical protein
MKIEHITLTDDEQRIEAVRQYVSAAEEYEAIVIDRTLSSDKCSSLSRIIAAHEWMRALG